MRKTLFLMGILAMVGSPVAMANSYISNETVTVNSTRSFTGNLSVGTYRGAGTLVVASGGQASTEYSLFIGGRGYWSPGTVPGDWAAGTPHEGTVTIAEGGSLTIGTHNGGQAGARQIVVGGAARGTLNIAGTLTTPGVLYVRDGLVNVSGTGLVTLNGSGAEGLVIGEYKDGYASASNGTVVVDGGTVQFGAAASNVTIGSNQSSSTVSGMANGSLVVRNGGVLNGGSSLVTVGYGAGAVGSLDIQSGAGVTFGGDVQVGIGGGTGSITLADPGSHLFVGYQSWLIAGDDGAGRASLNIGVGTTVSASNLSLGSNSTTTVNGALLVDANAEIHSGATLSGDIHYVPSSSVDRNLYLVGGGSPAASTRLTGQFVNLENVFVEGGTFYRMQGFNHLKSLTSSGGTLYLGTTTTDRLEGVGQDGRLVFVIGRDAVEHGSVVKAATVSGFGQNQDRSQASILFDMSSYGLDLIGRKVEFIEDQTNQDYVRFVDTLYVDNTQSIAYLGDNTFNDGTTRFDYVYTGTGIAFRNRLTTTIPPEGPVVNNEEKIEAEFVLGDTDFVGNTVFFTPDLSTGMRGRPVQIASSITSDNLLEAATTSYSHVYTSVTQNPDGSKYVVIDRQPLDMPADLAVLVRRPITVMPDGAERGVIGNPALGEQVNMLVLTGDGNLTLMNTDLMADKLLVAYKGSVLTLNNSTVTVGGSQSNIDASLAGFLGTSDMDGTTLNLDNDSSLTVRKVVHADTSFSIRNSTINFGTTGNNVIASGEGAPIDIVNSTINGNGVLNNVVMENVVVNPVNPQPGATSARFVTFSNASISNSLLNYDLGNVTIQSGGMNQFTLYLLNGAEQMNNVKISIHLTPGQEEAQIASMTAGTSFQLFQYGEGASFTGTLVSDPSLLPQLAPGLVWDLNNLSGGILSVIWEPIGDGQRIANTLRSAAMTARNFGQTALGHAADFRHPEGKNLWFSGLGYFDNASCHNGRTGYEYNAGGYAVGIDRTFDRTTIGFAFGQTFGTNKPKHNSMYYTAGKIEQNGKVYGLYGRQIVMAGDKDAVYVDGYAMTGSFDNKSEKVSLRNGQLSTGKWEEQAYSLGLIGTWRHEVAAATYIKPFVGLDYTAITMDKFTESNGAISSIYTDGSYSALTAVVGVGLERTYVLANNMELSPEVSVSYVGDISRKDGKVSYINDYSTPTTEYSVSPGRSAVQLDAAVNWKINDRWGARAGYGYSYRSGANSQVVSGLVSYAF